MGLKENIDSLSELGNPNERIMFRDMKQLELHGNYLIDMEGLQYNNRTPIKIIELKFGPGTTIDESRRLFERISKMFPRPHGFLQLGKRILHRQMMFPIYDKQTDSIFYESKNARVDVYRVGFYNLNQ